MVAFCLLFFRQFGGDTAIARDDNLFSILVHIMRVVQLKVLRWLGLGFSIHRRRLACAIVAVFIVILILHLLTYRDNEWVSSPSFISLLAPGFISLTSDTNRIAYAEGMSFS